MAKSKGAPKPPVVTEQAPEEKPVETTVEVPAESTDTPPVVTEQAPLASAASGVESTSNQPLVISTGSVSLSSEAPDVKPATNLVSVVIRYPKGYSGKKWFKNGEVREVSPETADIFKAKGIIE